MDPMQRSVEEVSSMLRGRNCSVRIAWITKFCTDSGQLAVIAEKAGMDKILVNL